MAREDLSNLIARHRARLNVLDDIQVARPCGADWNAMTGNDRVRRCGDCKQHVYNFSAMTRAEAEAVIVEHEGRMCSRYYARADGTILLADCTYTPVRPGLFAAGAAALALAGAGLWYARTAPERVIDNPGIMIDRALASPIMMSPPPTPPAPPPVRPVEPPVHVHQGVPPRHLDSLEVLGRK